MKTSLINRLNDIISKESIFEMESGLMPIPNISISITEFMENYTRAYGDIETRYKELIEKIDSDKKAQFIELESKIISEVKQKIKEEKTLSIKSCAALLQRLIQPPLDTSSTMDPT